MIDSLTGQFEASLAMFRDCVRRCPPEHWERPVANLTFRQVAYHTLFYLDVYLSPGEAAFELRDLHRIGGDDRDPTGPSAGFSQSETLEYVTICHEKLLATLASETAETLRQPSGFSWLPMPRGEVHLYNLRHLQHHTGQLSASLRKVVEATESWWVRKGWRE